MFPFLGVFSNLANYFSSHVLPSSIPYPCDDPSCFTTFALADELFLIWLLDSVKMFKGSIHLHWSLQKQNSGLCKLTQAAPSTSASFTRITLIDNRRSRSMAQWSKFYPGVSGSTPGPDPHQHQHPFIFILCTKIFSFML